MNQSKHTYAFHLQENVSASFPSGRFGPVAPVAYHRLVGIALSDPGTAFGTTPHKTLSYNNVRIGAVRLPFGGTSAFVGDARQKELKNHLKGTHISSMNSQKHHKNNAVRFTPVLAAGTTCWVIINLKQ
jgi:hypothetical protein